MPLTKKYQMGSIGIQSQDKTEPSDGLNREDAVSHRRR
jgi:hypothetical protein